MGSASQLIKQRLDSGERVETIAPGATVLDAARAMNDRHIGSLVVVGDDGRIAGIFTERDLLKRVVAEKRDPEGVLVEDVMTRDVIVCAPETRVDELRQLMRTKRIRHVPVVAEGGRLLGMVSIGDLNIAEVKVMTETIRYLEQYMTRL